MAPDYDYNSRENVPDIARDMTEKLYNRYLNNVFKNPKKYPPGDYFLSRMTQVRLVRQYYSGHKLRTVWRQNTISSYSNSRCRLLGIRTVDLFRPGINRGNKLHRIVWRHITIYNISIFIFSMPTGDSYLDESFRPKVICDLYV